MALNREIASRNEITYVRLMAEMDNYRNVYCAFNGDGSRRSADHSAAAYKAAWRRTTLILRGGTRASINAALQALRLPPLRGSGNLPLAPVAMAWVPMVAGAPDVAGNQPSDYFPGRQWVDWVGTDFYSKFPNFAGLNRFYAAFPGQPFVFGEWALWGADDPGFVSELFAWVHSHPRVRMLVYNQGQNPVGPFRLSHYPNAARVLRGLLAGPAFPAFTPDWLGNAARGQTPAAPARHHRRRRHRRVHHARRGSGHSKAATVARITNVATSAAPSNVVASPS
jgi:hypothetical protein